MMSVIPTYDLQDWRQIVVNRMMSTIKLIQIVKMGLVYYVALRVGLFRTVQNKTSFVLNLIEFLFCYLVCLQYQQYYSKDKRKDFLYQFTILKKYKFDSTTIISFFSNTNIIFSDHTVYVHSVTWIVLRSWSSPLDIIWDACCKTL